MLFEEKSLGALKDYHGVRASADFEYWIGLGMDTFGVYNLRFGRIGNYLQFLIEVPLGRNKQPALSAYKKLLKKLMLIAEYSEQPLHKLFADNKNDRNNIRFMTQVDILEIDARAKEKMAKKTVVKATTPSPAGVNISENGVHASEEDSASGEMAFEPWEEPTATAVAQVTREEDDEEENQLYVKRRTIGYQDFQDLILNMAKASGNVRTEYAHLPYDLILEVDIPAKDFKRTLSRAPLPKFTLWLGRFFRMYPGDYNKDFRRVLGGWRDRGGKRETYFLFDNAEVAHLYPDSTFPLPSNKSGRIWKPAVTDLGYAILEALGTKPPSIVGSKKIWRLKLEPMNTPGPDGKEVPLPDTRNFVVDEVATYFFSDGIVSTEKWEEIIGAEAAASDENSEIENYSA